MRGTKLVAVVALTALVLVGCGGGDDSGGDGGGTTGGGAGTTTGGDGGSFDGGALDAATCAQVVTAMAAAYSQSLAAMTGGDASDLQTSIDQLEAFAGSAPDEIADDMQVIASAYATMSQAFADIGWDPTSGTAPTPEQAAALQEATAAINTTEFQEASDSVSAWFADQCGS